jgi:outer membrane protein OmpA-like peptidoglycan-associated protein
MPSTRARMLPLALALVAVTAAAACGHKSAPTSEPPEHAASPAVPAPADPAEDPESAPATEQDTAIQTGEKTASKDQQVTFDDDADPEPTTQIQGAPKRPPMPRFKLFGTREGDGPN